MDTETEKYERGSADEEENLDVDPEEARVGKDGEAFDVLDRETEKRVGSPSESSAGKLFVGGIAWKTTPETFVEHFSKYGEISDSVIMKDKHTKKPRGFGFVTFVDPSVVEKVLKDDHVIDERTVEVKRTVPRGETAPVPENQTRKIFVGGIPTSVTDDELKEYFSSFGNVVEHQIMTNQSGISRGFGFVTFESGETVEEILSGSEPHEIKGKQVEIKKAEPKKPNESQGSSKRTFRGSSGFGSSNRYGGSRGHSAYGSGGGGTRYGYGPGFGYGAGAYDSGMSGAYGYGAGAYDGYGGRMGGYAGGIDGYGGGSGGGSNAYGGRMGSYGSSGGGGGYGGGMSGYGGSSMGAYGSGGGYGGGMGGYGGSSMGAYGSGGYGGGMSGYGGKGYGGGGYGSSSSSRYHPYGR